MLDSLGASLYRPLRATSSRHRPWQVAAAITSGVALGSIISFSPLGIVGLVAVYFLPVHLPLAVASTLFTAGCIGTLEPTFVRSGLWLMQMGGMREILANINAVDYAPWLQLGEPVVLGGLCFGLFQSVPTFLLTRRLAAYVTDAYRYHHPESWIRLDADHSHEMAPHVSFTPRGNHLSTANDDDPIRFVPVPKSSLISSSTEDMDEILSNGSNQEQSHAQPSPHDSDKQPDAHDTAADDQHLAEELAMRKVEQALASADKEHGDAEEVAKQASELAQLVDEMLSVIQDGGPLKPNSSDESFVQGTTSLLPELPLVQDDAQADSAETDNAGPVDLSAYAGDGVLHKKHAGHPTSTTERDHSTGEHEVSPHDETLRYLLHHLKEIRKRV